MNKKKHQKITLKNFTKILAIVFWVVCINASFCYGQKKTNWFKTSSYGVFVHHLFNLQNGREPWNQGKKTSWDSCINAFDVKKFAKDVQQTGAGYVIFTIQQNDRYFNCPNTTFERMTGYKRGIATPNRDLINDLYEALNPKGIRLMLYVTGNGPFTDQKSINALTGSAYKMKRNAEHGDVLVIDNNFLKSWSLVLKDISLRYKSKIAGWWVDGAYPFIGYNDASLAVLSKALKAGNKNAIVAFNQAPKDTVSYYTKLDDYTAGEMYNINSYPKKRFVNSVQWHALTFLGKDWGQPGLRFSPEQVEEYVSICNKKGGVITLDVCLFRDGSIDLDQLHLLERLKKNLKKPRIF